jgi:hypothetical protein
VSRTTDLLKQRKEALSANPGAVLRALKDSAGRIAALALHAIDGRSGAQDCVMRGRKGIMGSRVFEGARLGLKYSARHGTVARACWWERGGRGQSIVY